VAGDDGEDMAALAWPGFVDILSAVLMMFVFFVMITAVVLYFYTITYTSQIEEQAVRNAIIEQISDSTVQSTSASVVKELKRENETLKQKVGLLTDRIKMMGASLSESVQQKTIGRETDKELVIIFGTDAITLTKETKDIVEKFIARHKAENPRVNFNILASKNPEAATDSVARTLAMSRMFNVRNVLLDDNTGGQDISVSIISGEKIDDSFHWVKLVVSDSE